MSTAVGESEGTEHFGPVLGVSRPVDGLQWQWPCQFPGLHYFCSRIPWNEQVLLYSPATCWQRCTLKHALPSRKKDIVVSLETFAIYGLFIIYLGCLA